MTAQSFGPFAPGMSALVTELPQSAPPGDKRGFSQTNFTRAIFEGFFGASVEGDVVFIRFAHVGPDGLLASSELRRSVRATVSGNWRFELNAAKGRDYPDITRGRPIGMFIAIENLLCVYRIFLPGDAEHSQGDRLLTESAGIYKPVKGTRMRARHLTAGDLSREWPSNPVWSVTPASLDGLRAEAQG